MSEEFIDPHHLLEEGHAHNQPNQESDDPVLEPEAETAPFPQAGEAASTLPEPGVDQTLPDEEVTSIPKLEDIDSVRRLIRDLHPSIVPELINGDSVSDLIASIGPAEEAYSRIVANVRIPAGGNASIAFDADSLPTFDKIRRGLSAHTQRKA